MNDEHQREMRIKKPHSYSLPGCPFQVATATVSHADASNVVSDAVNPAVCIHSTQMIKPEITTPPPHTVLTDMGMLEQVLSMLVRVLNRANTQAVPNRPQLHSWSRPSRLYSDFPRKSAESGSHSQFRETDTPALGRG